MRVPDKWHDFLKWLSCTLETNCLLIDFGSVAAKDSLNDACHDLTCNLALAPVLTGLFNLLFENINLLENTA